MLAPLLHWNVNGVGVPPVVVKLIDPFVDPWQEVAVVVAESVGATQLGIIFRLSRYSLLPLSDTPRKRILLAPAGMVTESESHCAEVGSNAEALAPL